MSRSLSQNSNKILDNADKIVSFTSSELIKSYKSALDDIRLKITQIYEAYGISGELTKAEMTQFMRLSNIEKNIVNIMNPYLESNKELLKDMSTVGFDNGYFTSGWALDQATGLSLGWGIIDDNSVRAANGIGGDLSDLEGIISSKEIKQHTKVLDDAFTNYSKDSRKWISQEIKQGIIQGESVPVVTKRIKEALGKSYNSSMVIARTEILRASGIGSQIAYDEASDNGVQLTQVWQTTLDDRTRSSHASADGARMDNETGLFSLSWGEVPGPRRSGIASEDIQCRCLSVPEVEGYTPEVRRIRGEGLQPYQNFEKWATNRGFTTNRYGQKYNF